MDPGRRMLAVLLVVAAALVSLVSGDLAKDRDECSQQLVGLATCLTYVQDQAAAPTPDCCAGLKAVLAASRKCLCVLIRDKDDPSLGFKINVTRALALPALCKAPANIADCPKLLGLPPNSKDAQVFQQYAKQMGAPSPSATGGPSAAGAQKNGAAAKTTPTRWLGVGGARAAVVLSIFFPLALPFQLLLLRY